MITNFEEMRQKMVLGQLLPQQITHPKIIHCFKFFPREEFVPLEQRDLCYSDSALPIDPNRIMLAPAILARLIQEANITLSDKVLALGCSTGYSTMILSYLARKVIAIELDPTYIEQMNAAFEMYGIYNARAYQGSLTEGYPPAAPYTLIFIEGAIEEVPSSLLAQLEEGGRIVTLLKKNKSGLCKGVILEKGGASVFERDIFETQAYVLKEFEQRKDFEL